MLTAAYDPGLLREQETPLVIGKNWFLDQEIPAGGFVKIQDSSQVLEERVDETRIITTEGLTTCLDPGRGWTITSGGWNFLKKQECWEGHEQALITTFRKETKRTEELKEAGYSSPTCDYQRKLGWKRQARCTTGSCGAIQKRGRRKFAHLSSAGKKSSLTMMKAR